MCQSAAVSVFGVSCRAVARIDAHFSHDGYMYSIEDKYLVRLTCNERSCICDIHANDGGTTACIYSRMDMVSLL
jgi:hypothetical protein